MKKNVSPYGVPSLVLAGFILAQSSFDLIASDETEYSYVPVSYGKHDYQQYLDDLGVQRIQLVHKSSKDNKVHWTEVIDRNNQVLKRFGDGYSVSTLGEGRYIDKAMLLVSSELKDCKKNCRRNYLFGSRISNPGLSNISAGFVFDTLILRDGSFVSLSSSGLSIQNAQSGKLETFSSPLGIVDGIIGSDINGHWLAAAVSNEGKIIIADENGWNLLNFNLAAHGDRNGVLSIYPHDQGRALIAVYRYINEYNKGLYLLDYDFNQDKIINQGWLFNSEDRNIGFDPDIYFNKSNNEIVVSAINSSNSDEYVYMTLPLDTLSGLQPELPEHIQNSGFENEKIAALMLGGGISQVSWNANSRVKKNDVTFGKVDYLIADSLFLTANFEARLGNTSLTINYLKNKAEDLVDSEIDTSVSNDTANFLTKEASSYLFSTIDFQGMLNASSSLRLLLERSETQGVAEIDVLNQNIEYTEFTTRFEKVGLLIMEERGFYIGGDYVNYSMPSAVGFSNSTGNIVFTGYDPDFEFSSLRFVTGYDALAYTKRYETNYSRWYWAGGVNLGLGWATLSDQLKNDARQLTAKNKVAELPLFFVAGGELEFGYVWQKRNKAFAGLGYSAAIGYKVSGEYLGVGQSEQSSNNDIDSLFLEFSRTDIFYGPFFKANLIF